MLERTRRALLLAAAALLPAAACVSKAPYRAPPANDPAALDGGEAARVLVLVVAEADPRIAPPWLEKLEGATRAVEEGLRAAGFRTTRDPRAREAVRVTVASPLRGADFSVRVEAKGAVVDRFEVDGRNWGREELAELGRATRQRVERSAAVAELAGRAPATAPAAGGAATARTGPGPPPWLRAATAPAAKGRVAVLEFRGEASPQLLGLLGDQARAAAADAVRTAGLSVLTRERTAELLKEHGGPLAGCADGACEVKVARAVGADLAVTGEVARLGGAQLLVMKLLDVASGALLASRNVQGKDDLALVEATRPAAAALFD